MPQEPRIFVIHDKKEAVEKQTMLMFPKKVNSQRETAMFKSCFEYKHLQNALTELLLVNWSQGGYSHQEGKYFVF